MAFMFLRETTKVPKDRDSASRHSADTKLCYLNVHEIISNILIHVFMKRYGMFWGDFRIDSIGQLSICIPGMR